ncbi:melted [Asbolus verrucosus]|uniref:Melted n=1 Tax=Asbolus verrucosus TaxID=1661398 RepID=A0A482WE70_ASBVE|nr:melted [Asbolus verrucosus]
MHELFMQVLKNRDLSRAGDLFSVPDAVIVNDLTNVLKEITVIISLPDYTNNNNDQSVVEICVTRVTSCIRETGSVEQHCEALVTLLESCLHHNLQLTSRDEDPPHAKISSDIISCIFLLLEASVPQLCEYLSSSVTASPTLQIFLHMAEKKPALLVDHVNAMKQSAQRHPQTVCLAAQIIGAVGKLSKDRAQDALNFVLEYLPKADRGSQSTLLREATLLCSSYPVLFTDKVLAGVRQRHHTSSNQINYNNIQNQVTSGGVTIVKVGGIQQNAPTQQGGYTRRAKLGDSRSTGRLHTAQTTNTHRSMTKLNIPGGSIGGLHKSMTRLSSSQQINAIAYHSGITSAPSQPSNNVTVTSTNKYSGINNKISSGGVTVTTISPPRIQRPQSQGPLTLSTNQNSQVTITPLQITSSQNPNSVTVSSVYTGPISSGQVSVLTSNSNSAVTQTIPVGSNNVNSLSVLESSSPQLTPTVTSAMGSGNININNPVTVISRRVNNTSVTLLNSNQNSLANQRMSVFEPYPMRDTIQHFCEKHLDKIKAYMDKVSIRIPSPAKCTIEEKRQKKSAKLHFACQGGGQHCLYSKTYFTMRTRNPRIWIHLMFISLQSGGESIDVNQIRSVKVSRGARNIPKAFEIFTGNQTLILKPKDGKNAEEWVQCLSIVVAHSHAKELPGKSNSLPARGISSSRTVI